LAILRRFQSQVSAARAAGISEQRLSQIINGRATATEEEIIALMTILKAKDRVFLFGTGSDPSTDVDPSADAA
jgi:hypothetical protein